MIRAFLTAVAAISLAAGSCGSALCQAEQPYGAAVYGVRTASGSGSETWTYTLQNTSTSPEYTILLVQIEVDEGTDVVSASAPTGWEVDIKMPHFITLSCIGDDLLAGKSAYGFDVVYSACPEFQNWSAMFKNAFDPYESPADGGMVDIAAVPEPATLTALLIGLAALARPLKRRKD